MARYNNNSRVTPDAVQDYNLQPAASVVDKQSKYTPQVGDTQKLKQLAIGLSDLAKGATAVNTLMARQASEYNIKKYAETDEENRKTFADYSKNIEGFAKFNPFNREVYDTLRGDTHVSNAVLKYQALSKKCGDLTPTAFDTEVQAIQDELMSNLRAENIQAKNSYNALSRFQNAQSELKTLYVNQKAGRDYQKVQNQMVSSTALAMAINAAEEPSYIDGWNKSVTRLTDMANAIGMDNTKQAELLYKSVNQYLTDNVDDIDAEEFMIALGQTKINGTPLSDYDPNYATSMKQMLVKAKQTKYELDKTDLSIEKLRLEKASLAANKEIFEYLADPTKTDAEILSKAYEIIEAGGMEAIGMDYLKQIAGDKQTLLNLRTTQTNPEIHQGLMRKYIAGELSQADILEAVDNKQLDVKDASALFKSLQSEERRENKELITQLSKRYLADKPEVELGLSEDGTSNRDIIAQAVFDASDPNLSKAEQQKRLKDIKRVAQYMEETHHKNKSSDPSKLLTSAYMSTQKNRIKVQDMQDTQRALAKMGMLKNQANWNDSNIKVSSVMDKDRKVTLSDGRTVNRPHYGTDISTYTGRQIYAPYTGKVVASGHNASMGNYILFERADGKGFIKLMHLQAAELPRAGTTLLKGKPMAHVGNTGAVEAGAGGVLHIECFNKDMRLVDPVQFITGKQNNGK